MLVLFHVQHLLAFVTVVVLLTNRPLYGVNVGLTLLVSAQLLVLAACLAFTATKHPPVGPIRPVDRVAAFGLLLVAAAAWWMSGRPEGWAGLSAESASVLAVALLTAGLLLARAWPFDLWAALPATPLTVPAGRWLLMGVGGLSVIAVASELGTAPVNSVADMLPAIIEADRRALAGENPYAAPYLITMTFNTGPYYFAYLPVQWLTYLPAYAAGLDLRWVNNLLLLVALAVVSRNLQGPAGWKVLAVAALVLHPGFTFLQLHTEIMLPCTLFLLLGHCALRGQWGRAAIAYGVAVATSLWFLPPAPLLLAFLARRMELRRLVLLGGVAAVVAAAIVLPFAAADAGRFFDGFQYYGWDRTPKQIWDGERGWAFQPGLGTIGWWLGFPSWLPAIAVTACLALMAAVIARGPLTARRLLAAAGLVHVVFVGLNLMDYQYYYLPGVWLLLLALVAGDSTDVRQPVAAALASQSATSLAAAPS